MQPTSNTYKQLLQSEHVVDIKVEINGVFYGKNVIKSLSTFSKAFSGQTISVGGCVSGEIDIEMLNPPETIPKMAKVIPYVRLKSANNLVSSEWIKKGVYYIDTRSVSHNEDGVDVLVIHGYDSLAKASLDYDSSTMDYPATDRNIVLDIAGKIGVSVDARTWDFLNQNHKYGLPIGYSMAEILSYIASSYIGNWVMTAEGKLRLISILDIPKQIRYLSDENQNWLTFGGVKILV